MREGDINSRRREWRQTLITVHIVLSVRCSYTRQMPLFFFFFFSFSKRDYTIIVILKIERSSKLVKQ